ncbi:FMN-binding domain-containing protein [Williamwhitmania taraxaci]|uniref:FMN-binding domain-containing protein n=1 Tax=Williamwhitmania taraxaci TaxID=1640674 RepID=A0A1G6QF65_9BACT|nr:FMN-binding domain-containing protein [Williamwhitmania taraxaci]
MNLKKTILSLISAICFVSALAQTSIDYQPKALLKTLQKAGITDVSTVKELTLPELKNLQQTLNGKFFKIETNNVSQYKYIYVGRVNSCRAGGCSITHSVNNIGDSEYFDYYILFDKNKTVRVVTVFNYQATHGQEVTAKGWLKQFIGHNGSEPLKVDKNIDAISGATISVYAITSDIEMKTAILVKLR